MHLTAGREQPDRVEPAAGRRDVGLRVEEEAARHRRECATATHVGIEGLASLDGLAAVAHLQLDRAGVAAQQVGVHRPLGGHRLQVGVPHPSTDLVPAQVWDQLGDGWEVARTQRVHQPSGLGVVEVRQRADAERSRPRRGEHPVEPPVQPETQDPRLRMVQIGQHVVHGAEPSAEHRGLGGVHLDGQVFHERRRFSPSEAGHFQGLELAVPAVFRSRRLPTPRPCLREREQDVAQVAQHRLGAGERDGDVDPGCQRLTTGPGPGPHRARPPVPTLR